MSLNHNIPVSFGVLTTDTIEQAIERAGSKAGNKGFEAMTTVIEMLNLSKGFNGNASSSSPKRHLLTLCF